MITLETCSKNRSAKSRSNLSPTLCNVNTERLEKKHGLEAAVGTFSAKSDNRKALNYQPAVVLPPDKGGKLVFDNLDFKQ